MGKLVSGNTDELVLQLKTELAAVVEVLCVLHDFIGTSFGSKFQQFCESNSDLHDKLEVLKSLKSKCSQGEISADSSTSLRWNSNKNDDTTDAEREETTFSEWPDNVPVVMEDDPLALTNFAGKCEVEMEADEEDPLDFLKDELTVMNPDPLVNSSAADKASSNHNQQPKTHPGPSSKKAGPRVPPKPSVSSSSSDEEKDDRKPRSKSTKSSSTQSKSKKGEQYKCNMCPKTYSVDASLKRHFFFKHSASRPKFTCPHCGINVIDNFRLERHIRIHTGEKPFSCQYCHTKFSRNDYLKTHLKSCVKI